MRTAIRMARLIGIVSMALLLSGCLKLDQALTLNEDDTVDGTIVFAVDKGFLEMSGVDAQEFLDQTSGGEGPVPEGVEFETEPYEDDEYVGSTFTFEGAPLSAFSEAEGSDLSIVREGDSFVVTGAFDASSEGIDPTGTPGAEEILDSFDVRIAITFPGEVESATGEIDGNTVTWTPSLGGSTEISARGSAVASGGGGNSAMLWVVIGAIAVLVVVLVVVLGRRKSTPAPEAAADTEAQTQVAPEQAQLTPPPPAPVTEELPAPEPTSDLPPEASAAPDAPPAPAAPPVPGDEDSSG